MWHLRMCLKDARTSYPIKEDVMDDAQKRGIVMTIVMPLYAVASVLFAYGIVREIYRFVMSMVHWIF